MTTYTFEHTYFIDGDPDCPCCSGLQFDTYTLIKVDGVDISYEFEYDRCSWEDDCYKVALHHYNKIPDGEYPYDDVGEDWCEKECERLGVHIEIIGGEYE